MFGANAIQFDMDQSLNTEKEMKQFMNKPLLKNNMKENYLTIHLKMSVYKAWQ